jgi:CHAT domain-containing protein
VASLWKVDDAATAALVKLFFRKLWVEKKPPIDALREAQLTLYRHPDLIPRLAASRGVDVRDSDLIESKDKPPSERAHPKLWAGFVLSGMGREP